MCFVCTYTCTLMWSSAIQLRSSHRNCILVPAAKRPFVSLNSPSVACWVTLLSDGESCRNLNLLGEPIRWKVQEKPHRSPTRWSFFTAWDAELRSNPTPPHCVGQDSVLCVLCVQPSGMLVTRLTMVHSLCAHSYVRGLLPETAVRRGPDGEGPGDHRLGQLWVSNGKCKVTLGDLHPTRHIHWLSISLYSTAKEFPDSGCKGKAICSAPRALVLRATCTINGFSDGNGRCSTGSVLQLQFDSSPFVYLSY